MSNFKQSVDKFSEARDLAKRQLQNAYLATGRNSDGTERKQRGKKNAS